MKVPEYLIKEASGTVSKLQGDNEFLLILPKWNAGWDIEDVVRNLYKLDKQKNIIWRVEETNFSNLKGTQYSPSRYYTRFNLNGDKLTARQYGGHEVEIDIETGKVVKLLSFNMK